MTLDGKVAIVTGGGRGIGRGIALALAKAGAGVAILERDADDRAAHRRRDRPRSGGDAIALAGSVRERADCEAIVAAAVERFGGVDILVNNAQQVPMGPLDACTDDDMYAAWESGALAAFRLMQLCHPLMTARGGGAIVNLGSGAGTEGLAGLGAYAVAKEGIRALTKVAMLEWGADNIRVNTICPWAETDYWDAERPAARARAGAQSAPAHRRSRGRHRWGGGVPGERRRLLRDRSDDPRRRRQHGVPVAGATLPVIPRRNDSVTDSAIRCRFCGRFGAGSAESSADSVRANWAANWVGGRTRLRRITERLPAPAGSTKELVS